MYHEVARTDELEELGGRINGSYVVTDTVFREHLAALAEQGATVVSLDEVAQWLQGTLDLSERSVVLTFDDGFRGNYTNALPILEARGFRATCFMVTNRIGDSGMLGWSELRDMSARGMAVQSHTASHPLLSTIGQRETARELGKSKAVLEDGLQCAVRHCSLPNGDTNPWYREAARAAGYLTVCGSEFGRNAAGADPYFLKRIAVKRSTTARQLTAYLSDRWDVYALHAAKSSVKKGVATLLGKRRYDAIYNRLLGIAEQRKGDAS
jgi:peptidoglycan/xylan/chitin deacetylase (PgdA/CDA1 family)